MSSRNIHFNWIKAGPQATVGKANQNLIQFWCKAEQTGPAKVSLMLWKKWVLEKNWDSIMKILPSWYIWIPKWNFVSNYKLTRKEKPNHWKILMNKKTTPWVPDYSQTTPRKLLYYLMNHAHPPATTSILTQTHRLLPFSYRDTDYFQSHTDYSNSHLDTQTILIQDTQTTPILTQT